MKNSNRNRDTKSLKNILKSFVSQNSLRKGIRFSRKTLFVGIKSAALGMELSYKADIIIEKMNTHLDGEYINKIIIR